jgi:predicted Zn finger-like uncharacterized protein
MAIKISCPTCGAEFQAKDELAGKRVRCRACQGVINVPAAGRPAPAPKSAEPELSKLDPALLTPAPNLSPARTKLGTASPSPAWSPAMSYGYDQPAGRRRSSMNWKVIGICGGVFAAVVVGGIVLYAGVRLVAQEYASFVAEAEPAQQPATADQVAADEPAADQPVADQAGIPPTSSNPSKVPPASRLNVPPTTDMAPQGLADSPIGLSEGFSLRPPIGFVYIGPPGGLGDASRRRFEFLGPPSSLGGPRQFSVEVRKGPKFAETTEPPYTSGKRTSALERPLISIGGVYELRDAVLSRVQVGGLRFLRVTRTHDTPQGQQQVLAYLAHHLRQSGRRTAACSQRRGWPASRDAIAWPEPQGG